MVRDRVLDLDKKNCCCESLNEPPNVLATRNRFIKRSETCPELKVFALASLIFKVRKYFSPLSANQIFLLGRSSTLIDLTRLASLALGYKREQEVQDFMISLHRVTHNKKQLKTCMTIQFN
jgi:hypothetical protein